MDILIEDTTLREGEQSPGVAFSPDEKLAIVSKLVKMGIEAIEVGTPAMGGAEEDAIQALVKENHKCRLIGWNRGSRSDLKASFECGLQAVHIGLPSSDVHLDKKFAKSRQWVVDCMQEHIAFAKNQGAWVSVSAEDAGRADPDFLVRYARAVEEAEADRIRLSDTVGVLDPFRTYDLVRAIVSEVKIPVQVHMHNDFGLATANTLAGVRAGARHVHVTVNGLGERAGIAPIDEVIMGLRYHLQLDLSVRTEGLRSLARFVAEASRRPIPANKPITGGSAFVHESGIHVDGTLKTPDAFEPFPPAVVGARRSLVIGKHSGRAALRYVLASHCANVPDDVLERLLVSVRREAGRKKRSLTPAEVLELLEYETAR